jgi:hypothetical protein
MSANATPALKSGEAGAYCELVKRPLPEGHVLFFIPSLAGMLFRAQQENGARLTEDEVLQIRDRMGVMVMSHDHARAMEERRGYVDIDPADAWQSWLRLQEAQA